jgi:hypothetical protein
MESTAGRMAATSCSPSQRSGKKMKRTLITLFVLLFSLHLHASESAQVMLFGTFHFQDAGLDVVKSKDINVFTAESQEYLQGLAQRLADFKPTRVLLEYNPRNDEEINGRYRDYLAGKYELPANEIYQLGFRLAKQAGHTRVYSFDNRDVEWQADAMFEYAKQHDSPEMNTFNEIIRTFTEEDEQARATLSLRELLMRANDADLERRNMDLYLSTNSIGAGDGYAGADSSASWWERNFRIYANIQQLAGPGERIIAIGGSGHMAILKQLLEIDQRLEAVAVNSYFD